MVYYFLEGGAFMWPILLTLIFGLAFVIERAYSLMMSGVDSQAFLTKLVNLYPKAVQKQRLRYANKNKGLYL